MLKAKLNTNDWKVKLKALAALEAVAKDGSGIAQYFVQQCPSDVQENLSSAQATLKAQAQKTCAALGLDNHDSEDSGSSDEEEAAPAGPLFTAEPEKKPKKSSKSDKKAEKEARKAERKKKKAHKADAPAAPGRGGMFSGMTQMTIASDDESEEEEEAAAQVYEEPEPVHEAYEEPQAAVPEEPLNDLICLDETIVPKKNDDDAIALEDLFGDAPATSQPTTAPGFKGMPQSTMPIGSMSQMGMGQHMGMMGQQPSNMVQAQLGQQQMMQQQLMQQQMMQQQYMMLQRQQQHMAMQPSMTSNGISFALGQQNEAQAQEQQRQKSKFNFIGDTVKREAGQ